MMGERRMMQEAFNGDSLQTRRRQFERVALSGVFSAPDWYPCLGSDLSDQTELHKLFGYFEETCALQLVGRGQAKVLALRCSAQHHKLCIGQFDAHGPTLSLILEAQTIRAPHQDEPRIGQKPKGRLDQEGRAAAPDNDTNASFRTESQSFLRATC
jgi:hypothetical protein